jgi:hydrogenase nickel incorporation protein HypA/HybF
MHEFPVTQSILDIALRHAQSAGASQILRINITVGDLASIVDDSVQFYWDIISKDTPAEGAKLVFTRLPITLLCLNCNQQYIPEGDSFYCPICESNKIKVIGGQEFFLESIDVE